MKRLFIKQAILPGDFVNNRNSRYWDNGNIQVNSAAVFFFFFFFFFFSVVVLVVVLVVVVFSTVVFIAPDKTYFPRKSVDILSYFSMKIYIVWVFGDALLMGTHSIRFVKKYLSGKPFVSNYRHYIKVACVYGEIPKNNNSVCF